MSGADPNDNRHIILLNNHMQKVHQLEMLTTEQSSTGPPHNPVWTVTYYINGQVMGSATAPQKWKAKDAAAKKTLVALGVLTT